jgi:hypothetical protein
LRLVVYDDIVTVSNYVASKYNFSYVYFHSLISGLTKEPATTLRRVHARLDAQNRGRMQAFHMIHPTKLV